MVKVMAGAHTTPKIYYISEIAPTLGWINTMDTSEFETELKKHNIQYEKILCGDMIRGELCVYKVDNIIIIFSHSGLIDEDNRVVIIGENPQIEKKIVNIIFKFHLNKIDINELLNYHKDMDSANRGFKVLNPHYYTISKNMTKEKAEELEKIIEAMKGKELSIEEIKKLVKEINRLMNI